MEVTIREALALEMEIAKSCYSSFKRNLNQERGRNELIELIPLFIGCLTSLDRSLNFLQKLMNLKEKESIPIIIRTQDNIELQHNFKLLHLLLKSYRSNRAVPYQFDICNGKLYIESFIYRNDEFPKIDIDSYLDEIYPRVEEYIAETLKRCAL